MRSHPHVLVAPPQPLLLGSYPLPHPPLGKEKTSSLPSLGSSAGGFILVSVLLSLLAVGL